MILATKSRNRDPCHRTLASGFGCGPKSLHGHVEYAKENSVQAGCTQNNSRHEEHLAAPQLFLINLV